MKRLLTFIYGLLLIVLSFVIYYQYTLIQEWYRYIYILFCIIIMFDGIKKLNKATK